MAWFKRGLVTGCGLALGACGTNVTQGSLDGTSSGSGSGATSDGSGPTTRGDASTAGMTAADATSSTMGTSVDTSASMSNSGSSGSTNPGTSEDGPASSSDDSATDSGSTSNGSSSSTGPSGCESYGDGTWGDCVDDSENCGGNQLYCAVDDPQEAGAGTCVFACTDVCDCPGPPPGFEDQLTCGQVIDLTGNCYIDCSNGGNCPDTMICVGGFVCMVVSS